MGGYVQGGLSLDVVSLLYELSRKEREKHIRKPEVFWVTDLVRCPLKRDYELRFPELVESNVFTPTFILGELIHKGLEALLKEVMPEEVEVEVEKEQEVMLPNGSKVFLRGRADVIVKVGGEYLGIEIKTSRSDVRIPQEHHVDQSRIYNWLFNLKASILLYVTPDRVTQYVVDGRATLEEVVERILSSKYPRYEWECRYCAYSVLCPYKVVLRQT